MNCVLYCNISDSVESEECVVDDATRQVDGTSVNSFQDSNENGCRGPESGLVENRSIQDDNEYIPHMNECENDDSSTDGYEVPFVFSSECGEGTNKSTDDRDVHELLSDEPGNNCLHSNNI